MMSSASADPIGSLQECLSLANDFDRHPEAIAAFSQLQEQLSHCDPQAAKLVEMMWKEIIAARRSATFWERICDVERGLTEQMAASHFQLQQNYLRLMQEQ